MTNPIEFFQDWVAAETLACVPAWSPIRTPCASRRIAGMPTGRLTTPEEGATLVVVLASPRTADVTGANDVIDAGLVMTM